MIHKNQWTLNLPCKSRLIASNLVNIVTTVGSLQLSVRGIGTLVRKMSTINIEYNSYATK